MLIENQNKEHIEFLREHLKLLTRLKETGYKCDREINDALSKLHGIVFKQDPSLTLTFGGNSFVSNGGNQTNLRFGLVDSDLYKRFREAHPKLTSVDSKIDRGKGKTTILFSYCYDEGALIVVGTSHIAKLYREIYQRILEKNGYPLFLGAAEYILTVEQLNGRRGKVFIDESVSEKQLNIIKENKNVEILGGFFTST
ncbi:hypothetical protein [Bacillus sp. MZGC1]|uniref:hypothetical protein n=1 Tax=Bacillus sp. MZGC1 TaxID=2108543 RepID=UPI000D027E32|nr:hypothetical protein [Bacillus sp. MZGC1]PRS47491.1 hypothetical protein C6Y06_18240 [Bacillus sp. MZGC1]